MSFTLPSGYTAIPGATILSSVWNACMNAIAAELNLKKATADIETAEKGGTGISTATATGVPVIDGGTWSVGATLPVTKGGTGAATAAAALTALGAAPSSRYPRGYLFDLTLSNGTDATNDIDIAVGECTSDDAAEADRVLIANAAVLTKRLDAAWSVGDDAGGLDTGSIANTTYHVFLIKRTDTGVVDALFSASLTPTMPTGYTKKRRIGSILRESAAIVPFLQDGDTFLRITSANDYSNPDPGAGPTNRTVAIPTGLVLTWIGSLATLGTAAGSYIWSAVNPTATSSTMLTCYHQVKDQLNRASGRVLTNASAQIATKMGGSDGTITGYITTCGWVDPRKA